MEKSETQQLKLSFCNQSQNMNMDTQVEKPRVRSIGWDACMRFPNRSKDGNWPDKKSPGRLPTWKNDRKAGGGRTVTSVAAEFGINKSVISRAWKAFQTTGTAVRKVGGSRPRTTTAGGWPIYPPAGEKEQTAVSKRHCSATLYSNGATSVVV
ncbi:hypothetical protein TNCV_3709151 [Trichonephila clavipes]|nr:hypothetical protein TNCV_3709151 [Trichonephila clavipes]